MFRPSCLRWTSNTRSNPPIRSQCLLLAQLKVKCIYPLLFEFEAAIPFSVTKAYFSNVVYCSMMVSWTPLRNSMIQCYIHKIVSIPGQRQCRSGHTGPVSLSLVGIAPMDQGPPAQLTFIDPPVGPILQQHSPTGNNVNIFNSVDRYVKCGQRLEP